MIFLKKQFIFFLLLSFPFIINAQSNYKDPKQTNVTGKDVIADTPWHMKKTNGSGGLNGIPVHVFIKDANLTNSNADLIYVNIYIKNAKDASFGNPITFNTYTDSAFLSLFSAKSVTEATLDVQSFDESLPVKDPNYTIQFTKDNSWLDGDYVNVNHQFWYFTITIPPDKLVGFDDIVDIKVYFSLGGLEADDELYFRVFRYDNTFPKLQDWYRGEAHYHTMYTNNSAEYGLPLVSTKEIAKIVGLDWITSTNHSCDYDEYGSSIQSNWNRETSEIQTLNDQDNSMLFIHSEEASVKNSAGSVVHMLCYPQSSSPYSLPYLGDGGGDLSSTSITINNIIDTLTAKGGFAYAAHPFSGGDKLSSLISGGIWNLNDAGFLANGANSAGHDVVICNNTSYASDIFSTNTSMELFKSKIKGGQIWNYHNTMATTDESFNPWNVTYDSGITPFVVYDSTNTSSSINRFLGGLEVTKYLLKKGLIMKNNNNALNNYKFYISAGSDAHGDFNYCNTNFVYGVTGDISDDAIGKLTTLVYCPSGMGNAGSNILSSLENGNSIISDGPLVSIGISIDGNNSTSEYIVGQEATPTVAEYQNAKLKLDIVTSAEFGNFNKLKFIVGTQNGEHTIYLPLDSSVLNKSYIYNVDSLLLLFIAPDSIQDNKYFYIRAELTTYKNYGTLSSIYKRSSENFNCYTNPIWIKKPAITVGNISDIYFSGINFYPNPVYDNYNISLNLKKNATIHYEIFDFSGRLISKSTSQDFSEGEHIINITTESLATGIYTLNLTINNQHKITKFTKLND
ncbi:MAG TPA: T9SS type A sorting domain-containing protein [Bacteroidales bacterium]|nr:T9SS type A sorting domain-containing protein [Bacteroidales bacterium]HPS18396.1 T9SS type A sorting domain-containing protein [Bacteroidales bacterium]